VDRLGVIGTSYKLLDTEAIADYHLGDDPLAALQTFKAHGKLDDLIYLPTCNRIEFWYRGDPTTLARIHRTRLTAWYRQRGVTQAGGHHFYALQGSQAAKHLLRVACSLDSMVVGEVQILDQLKAAHEFALEHGLAGPGMTRLLEVAYQTAHQVRRETRLCERPVSVASLAAGEVLATAATPGRPCPVLLIGAGQTMAKAGSRLVDNPTGQPVTLAIANRTSERASRLAREVGGTAIPLEAALVDPPAVQAVMTATSATEPLLDLPVVARLAARRPDPDRPLLIVDLGLPADLAPAARELEDVRAVVLDDLKAVAERNLEARQGEVQTAEAIVDRQMGTLDRRMAEIAVGPAVCRIQERYLATMERELDRLLHNGLGPLGDKDRDKLQRWARSTAKRLAGLQLEDTKQMLVHCERCASNASCLEAIRRAPKDESTG